MKKKIEVFEKKLEQFSDKGMDNHVVIKDLTLDHPVVEKLTFHLDKLQLKEVSGALNLGNNFGVNVRPKSQKSQPKPKPHEQQSEKPPQPKSNEEKPKTAKPKENQKPKEKQQMKKKKPKQKKENVKPKTKKMKKPEQKMSEKQQKPEQPQTTVSPSTTPLKANRTENGFRIRF
ncbi:MAG TPA: hypothetical protein VFK33_02120 [Bacillales bacterium]|nr:hypothetical protein [Bacillales bacterium]